MSYVTIRSATGDNRVVLWERDPKHPGGEVFVAGDNPVAVCLTAAVTDRIRDGLLDVVEVGTRVDAEPGPVKVEPVQAAPLLNDVVPEKWLDLLAGINIHTLFDLADADPDLLVGIKGIGPKTAATWIADAQHLLN